MNAVLVVVYISLAVASASITITKTKVFEGVRGWISGRSDFFGKLFKCPYCLSHWLAAAGVLWYRPLLLNTYVIADLMLSWLCVVTNSTFASYVIWKALLAFDEGASSHGEKQG